MKILLPVKTNTTAPTVTFLCTQFPEDWETQKEILCLALGKGFPHPRLIPDEPNPRKAKTNQGVYTAIVQTLTDEPEFFHEINNGVYLYANIQSVEDLEDEVKAVTLVFNPPTNKGEIHQGHRNGGHTMLALHDLSLKDKDLSKVRVKLTIKQTQPTVDDRRKACDSQVSYRHDKKTRYNALCKFDLLKEKLPQNWKVVYFQNQSEDEKFKSYSLDPRCSIDHILQTLGMIAPKFYWMNISPGTRYPVTYRTNLSNYYDAMLENANQLVHLADNVAEIEFLFYCYALEDRENLLSGIPTINVGSEFQMMHPSTKYILSGIHAPRSSVFPTLSAFRVILEYNKTKDKYDWMIPWEEKYYKPLVKKLWLAHKQELHKWVAANSKNPLQNLLTRTEHWQNLHVIAYQHLQDLEKEVINKNVGWNTVDIPIAYKIVN